MTPDDACQPGKVRFTRGPSLMGALWAWIVARVWKKAK